MRKLWENQLDNLFLFVPFLMAAGGALYFGLHFEPNVPFAPVIAIFLFAVICMWRAPIFIRAILIFIFGFCYAYAYTNIIDTPILTKNLRDIEISGRVTNIDYTDTKARIYIRVPATDLNIKSNDSAVVRVSVDADVLPNINDTIETTATLFTPTPADAPGAFDFARWSYFNGITATGYSDGFTIKNHATHGTTNSLREYIHTHANSVLVDSLVLGYKHTLSKDARQIWTASGVGHVWSISGFHMTLIMGWLFALFYFIFRAIPPIVRRTPAKHIAMICAWMLLILYVVISGGGVATLRAFLMATLICGAALLGRGAFSLRNVCMTFCLIFLINPYYIMTAGFQLSFSAIFGLIWFWKVVNPKLPSNKILRIIITAILTAFIASVFTAPFIAAHFNSLPIYSIIGNLILLPIFSILIMPLVIIGTIFAIFGLHFPLTIADTVYNFSLHIANIIANLPNATLNTPYISNTALCFIIIGMICIMFIKPIRIKINYIIGCAFISVGIITIYTTPKPVFFATTDHELVASIDNDTITFNKSRASNHFFTFDTWKHFAGISYDTPNTRAKHKSGLYIFKSQNITIAYMQKFTTLQDNIAQLCNNPDIDYIVSYLDINSQNCEHKILRNGLIMYKNGKIIRPNYPRRWNNLH